MDKRALLLQIIKEIIWWVVTAMLAYAVLYPVTAKVWYLHYNVNFFFIFLTLTYFRWTLNIRTLPFLRPAWVRFGLFAVNIVLFMFCAQQEQKFLGLFDNFYTEDFGFPQQGVIMFDDVKQAFFRYLYRELVFFNTGALIMIFIFNLRLLVSWWQFYKYQANVLMEE